MCSLTMKQESDNKSLVVLYMLPWKMCIVWTIKGDNEKSGQAERKCDSVNTSRAERVRN